MSQLRVNEPFAEAAGVAQQSALYNIAETGHLALEIVLGHIEEEVPNIKCLFGPAHGLLAARRGRHEEACAII